MKRRRRSSFTLAWGVLWLLSSATPMRCAAGEAFLRGDVDGDSRLSVSDAVLILLHLFGGTRVTCEDAADANDSGALDLTDAVTLLRTLFSGGPPLPAPFPACGEDSTADELGCTGYEGCLPSFDIGGTPVVGDGVFFVIERSGTMSNNGELMFAKGVATRTIKGLPNTAELAIVFTDDGVLGFPEGGDPVLATDDAKADALRFLESTPGGSGACPEPGLLAALQYATRSTSRRRVVVFLSGGDVICRGADTAAYHEQTLQSVSEANQGRAHIYTVGVMNLWGPEVAFLKALAHANGGDFILISK